MCYLQYIYEAEKILMIVEKNRYLYILVYSISMLLFSLLDFSTYVRFLLHLS